MIFLSTYRRRPVPFTDRNITRPLNVDGESVTVPELSELARFVSTELGYIQQAIPVPYCRPAVTANYTATLQDDMIPVDCTAAGYTITLPLASQVGNKIYTIKKIDSSGNAVTIGATVDGAANPTIATQWQAKTVQSDGTSWYFRAIYP